MKKSLLISCFFISLRIYSQDNPTAQAQPIVAEGKLMYRSEMASWYGTDIFIEKHKDMSDIGGYVSYSVGDSARCIFFSKGDKPQVIGSITFDSTYDLKTAVLDLGSRPLTTQESDLCTIRKLALAEINSDTMFKSYKNCNLNLVPLIHAGEKKVYVLTGPQQSGVVIIGNDYLLTFDENNKLLIKKQLHKNIIPIYYGKKEDEDKKIIGAAHTHLPETGNFITATDICTLMLYAKFTGWLTHTVVSEKYINHWNCLTNQLTVVPK